MAEVTLIKLGTGLSVISDLTFNSFILDQLPYLKYKRFQHNPRKVRDVPSPLPSIKASSAVLYWMEAELLGYLVCILATCLLCSVYATPQPECYILDQCPVLEPP